MLVLLVLKSKLGRMDVSLVLYCLNKKAPTKALLQKKFNNMSNPVSGLNEDQMMHNQQYVQ
ncbi:hypothetical protein DPMN_099213 [Dreissena polymorpha]|uniref:Uncharacterized protein n=1 Tax=Dreissena polymorpha TaxID=45954 RepID=A0A9D4R677_DREPO|nr:hypothetical protein DPMN_099213 [Dreissena polymorpha]